MQTCTLVGAAAGGTIPVQVLSICSGSRVSAELFRSAPAQPAAAPPQRSLWEGGWQAALAVALLVAIGYYGGAKLGLALTSSPNPISVLWPPNSILLAALLLVPARAWWVVLAAAFPAHLLAELGGGVPTAMVLAWFASNTAEALIGALGVRLLLRASPTFESVREVGAYLLCGAFLAPFLSSFLDAGLVRLLGWGDIGYWQLWRTRLFSNILAAITIAPVILTWARGGWSPRAAAPARVAEGLVLGLGLAACGALVFDLAPEHGSVPPALLYLPLPFLLWAALRFGPAGSSATLLLVTLLAIWGAGHGHGPFLTGAPAASVLSLQMFLIFAGATMMVLVALTQESRAAERRLRSSEQRFAAAFRSGPDAMMISRRADRVVLDINQRGLQLLGCRREELVGRSAPQVALGTVESVRDYPLRLRTGGGETVQTLVSTEPIEVEGVPCYITILRDVTELKRAEETLQRNDERFWLVLRATNDVIYDWNIGADRLWWNRNGEAYFGRMSEGGPSGIARWSDQLHPEDRERATQMLKAFIDGHEQVWDIEYRLRRADGTYAAVHGRGLVVRNEAGMPQRMIGSLMDVTDRKRAEDANQRLAHVSRLAVVGELTASIAHEINQPLGAILSNVDAADILLDRDPVPMEELRQIIADIRTDDMRAGEVIRHMRALLRRRELAMLPFDLNRAISDVLGLASADLGRHRVAVESEFGQLPPVLGDQVHLQQVVLNLILNGVDAMSEVPASRRRLGIRTARREGGGVEVSVWDSGPGIAEEHAQLLFDSFFTTKSNGMGLGLSIARSIIEAHGGTIRAETRREGGARFSFFLPSLGQKPDAKPRPSSFGPGVA